MKQIGLLLLLLATGLWVGARTQTSPAPALLRVSLLTSHGWVWVSWTEKAGSQAAHERIRPCMQDDVIRFERVDGQNVYREHAGGLSCGVQDQRRSRGEWELAPDGRTLTIRGSNSTFENSWQVSELTVASLKLTYRTNTAAGPFVMTVAFAKR